MEEVFNLTPHDVHIHQIDGTITTIPSSGELRLATVPQILGPTLKVGPYSLPLAAPQEFTGIDETSRGYPVFKQNIKRGARVGFIVSAIMAEQMLHTFFPDPAFVLLAPGTGPAFCVRDNQGRIIGTKRLEMYSPTDFA